jgi:hypothetical protein
MFREPGTTNQELLTRNPELGTVELGTWNSEPGTNARFKKP